MALIAMCMPILPGKKGKWQEMANQLKAGPVKSAVDESRKRYGVRERSYLQETPAGDFVIVTLEGTDPMAAFGKMMADPSMKDFMAWASDVHGVDFSKPPPEPKLVYDSEA
jgi:hypothetical protein